MYAKGLNKHKFRLSGAIPQVERVKVRGWKSIKELEFCKGEGGDGPLGDDSNTENVIWPSVSP